MSEILTTRTVLTIHCRASAAKENSKFSMARNLFLKKHFKSGRQIFGWNLGYLLNWNKVCWILYFAT